MRIENDNIAGTFEVMRAFHAGNRYKQILFDSLWVATNVNGGSVITNNFFNCVIRSSAVANSSSLYRAGPLWGFNAGGQASFVDLSKKTSFLFTIYRSTSDAQAVSRVQFKETNSTLIAALAERGVGLQLDNLALTGEAFGTSRGTVALGTILSSTLISRVEIRLDSTGCEFFVENVPKGKISTAGLFPAAMTTAECDGFITHANGAAGTNSDFGVGNMAILQEG